MDFVIIGNSWDAGRDNPTSKHQVALALAAKGHKVLWIDGAGMRRPSLGSGSDRAKIAGKLSRAMKGAVSVRNNIWRITPLILPLPGAGLARMVNEWIYLRAVREGMRAAGMSDAVLINFLPTIPGVMRRRQRTEDRRQRTEDRGPGAGSQVSGLPLHCQHKVGQLPCGLRRFQVCRVVYYCVDRWDQFGSYDSGLMEKLDAECCRNADLVIASAQDLFERCRRHNANAHLIPHGVEHAHFANALAEENVTTNEHGYTRIPGVPASRAQEHGEWNRDGDGDACLSSEHERQGRAAHLAGAGKQEAALQEGRKGREGSTSILSVPSRPSCKIKRIGFFGLVSEWVDQELLLKLAGIDGCEVVLAGKADVDVSSLSEMSNIRLIGPVPYKELPELVGSFDVCIIPFMVNDLTKAVNPIKLREMLAAGCPVVSTDLPEVRKLAEELPAGAVSVARDRDEFVKLVREQLERRLSLADRKAISSSVKDQDWSSKVDQILSLLG